MRKCGLLLTGSVLKCGEVGAFKNKKLTSDGAKVGWLSKPKCEWMPRNLFRVCEAKRISVDNGM